MNLSIHTEKPEHLGFSPLFKDYLRNDERITQFFHKNLTDLESLAISQSAFKVNAQWLDAYNEGVEAGSLSSKNIEKLKNGEALAIVTGQQMSLAGGALLILLKALTAVSVAERLSRKIAKCVVPVFWIADEDHDLAEVLHLYNPEAQKFTKPDEHLSLSGNLVSRIQSNESFLVQIDEFFACLADTEFKNDLHHQVRSFYVENSLKNAFVKTLKIFLDELGIVFAGSENAQAKALVKETLSESVIKRKEISFSLSEQSNKLKACYHQQAHISDTCLFYIDSSGTRHRIDHAKTNLTCAEKSWSEKEILNEIQAHPERFSPNVFLRPILQDKLLPTLGYVAGPGETAYYAQSKLFYEVLDMDMPVIIPRWTATIVEPGEARIFKELPFSFSDYSKRIEILEKEYVNRKFDTNINEYLSTYLNNIRKIHSDITIFSSNIDPTLKATSERSIAKYENEINRLRNKLIRAVKNTNKIDMARIHRLKQAFYPEDTLQERLIPTLYFVNKYGIDFVIQLFRSISGCCPDTSTHKIVEIH